MQEAAISLVENLHRKALSPVEMGEAFWAMRSSGMTAVQVARQCGTSDFTVSVCCRIVRDLIPEARDACHRGELPMTLAYQLARLSHDIQRARFCGEYRKVKAPQGRKSHAEKALADALAAYRSGDKVAALGFAERAIDHLRSATKGTLRPPRA